MRGEPLYIEGNKPVRIVSVRRSGGATLAMVEHPRGYSLREVTLSSLEAA